MWLHGRGGAYAGSVPSQGELCCLLPVPAGAAPVTPRLKNLGIRRVRFGESIPDAFCFRQSQGKAEAIIGRFLPTAALGQLAK